MAQKPKLRCDIRASLANAFKSWRKVENVPLKQVAPDLGLSVNTIDMWELGKRFPTGRHFEILVEYTGVPPCRLFCVTAECLLAMPKKPLSAPLFPVRVFNFKLKTNPCRRGGALPHLFDP